MRRSRLALIVGVALLALGAAGILQWRSHARDGSAALTRGLAALDKGDARTARVELMNAIKRDPRSTAAHVAQAQAQVDLGDGAGAQAAVERARTLGSPPAATRAIMAQALLLQGDMDSALKEARAADLPPDAGVLAARVIAQAMLGQGDLPAARAALQHALANAPGDPANWVELGRLQMVAGDQAGAIMAADRAVALAPGDAKALTLRGELTRAQYGLAASLPWFERALAANPDSVPTLEQYAATLADAGQASHMLGLTRRLLALDPSNPRAWMMQAVMAARVGQGDLARKLLERTKGRLDDEPATRLLRGILQLQDGNPVLATEALAPLVAAQPDNRTARTLLARALYDNDDFASAATTLAPIVAQRDADPYVLTLAARVQEALGNRAMAGDMLARAAWPVRASSDSFASSADHGLASGAGPASSTTARDNIPYIRALLSTGRNGDALARARLLSRANPRAPDAWLILGDTLGAANQPQEAAHAYEAAGNIRFDRDAALRLAAAWTRAGNAPRARQVVQLFLSQNPNDVEVQRVGADMAMQAQDWRGARRMLQAVRAQIGDNDAVLMADLARAAMEDGDRNAARAYAAHGYRLMPGNPVTADMFGWVLLRSGEKGPAAVDLLEKAVALAPGAPALQLHLGQAYAAAGRKGEAKLALGRAAAVRGFVGRQDALDALAAL
ncbi:tetratricopeptide repeat protein [Sphingobium limneticum]|uniref:Tetratricopeptide repeat protein n=1 Tax=Sphingobium limneticum TaxID=1007511 RepID=A0A5J5I105_9SPHN|nr:tetratricopeptide repeat protein [Sphingobium limneticum]KAA9015827.1 tetratricopeptide repeat protein [Sphingobium limneticum]KAA9028240.1 tetratricopeptide repeat protein [Sphingobium limneticum]